MNMRMHVNKRFTEICFFILVLLCSSVDALKDRKFIHQEVIENQHKAMDRSSSELPRESLGIEKIQAPVIGTKRAKGDDPAAGETVAEGGENDVAPKEETEPKEEQQEKPAGKEFTFWSGFVDSLSMIFFVEFGDRTFMIVVLFTMKHDKWKVFIPAIFTMMGMHIISVGFGTLFPLLFSRNTIVYFSVFLFLFFGIMMIYEAYHMQPKTAEEKVEEIQNDLLAKNDPETNGRIVTTPEGELPMEKKEESKYFCTNPYLHLVVLLFLADWGDRCQIAAIVLTATHNAWGVAVGGALVRLNE
eukprot:TRINITY_DN9559_c0_g1_i7.p1 TRINITY_DN9559_c0_g1~~TRINITY_DN9559_c0_g1_i7.p1  ORF type:complete len:301 (+),score=73.38 TRINITY_DN9559_c0_g1_i7:220-1122(+)